MVWHNHSATIEKAHIELPDKLAKTSGMARRDTDGGFSLHFHPSEFFSLTKPFNHSTFFLFSYKDSQQNIKFNC